MYKIRLTCYDPPYSEGTPYFDYIDGSFEYEKDAELELLRCVINEVGSLNEPDSDFVSSAKIFVPMLNIEHDGRVYNAGILFWDSREGINEQPVTLYDIVWDSQDNVDELNRRLRETYGKDITIEIRSVIDDDGIEKFFFFGAVCGESDWFDTPEDAYKSIEDYLKNISLYVD